MRLRWAPPVLSTFIHRRDVAVLLSWDTCGVTRVLLQHRWAGPVNKLPGQNVLFNGIKHAYESLSWVKIVSCSNNCRETLLGAKNNNPKPLLVEGGNLYVFNCRHHAIATAANTCAKKRMVPVVHHYCNPITLRGCGIKGAPVLNQGLWLYPLGQCVESKREATLM